MTSLTETTKFTPGPWHQAGQRGEFVNDSHEMNVCRVNPTVSWAHGKSISDGMNSHDANALLISAAPQLLEALEELYEIAGEATIPMVSSHAVRKMGKFMAARDRARAVIKKAKGE